MFSSGVYAQVKNWDNCIVDGVPTLKCLEVVFGNFLFWMNSLVILALFVMFVLGSYTYLTSFGSPEKIKKARGIFEYAVIGLILYIASYAILRTIDILFLGGAGSLFKFEIPQ